MNAMQLPLNLLGSDPLFPLKLGSGDLLPALGIAVSGLAAHLCMTNAFRHGDATVVVPLDFFRLPLIALIGFRLHGEPPAPMPFRRGDATVVVPLDFFRLPLIALIGFWFYGEALDPMVFVGAALIIAGVLWNLRDAARQT